MNSVLISILAGIVGIAIGIAVMTVMSRNGLDAAKKEAQSILEESNAKAENIVRQATLDGKQQVYEMKMQAEKELKSQRDRLQTQENKLVRREDNIGFREENLNTKEKKLDEKTRLADEKLTHLSKMEEDLKRRIDSQIEVLEKAAGIV